MSRIQEIIKCPVCNRIIATESTTCHFCESCNQIIDKSEDSSYTFLDFRPNIVENKPERLTSQLFANSFLPWFYENLLPTVWRMGLRGFGGIEREFKEVLEFFGDDLKLVMDLSCGTGIMTRKLASYQYYQSIIALDYSESMLTMLKNQLNIEKTTNYENLFIIRGNAESIPLIDNSIDAVYAGAAIHCWEHPQKGIEEIYRVLRQGGKLFATTFTKIFPDAKMFIFLSIEEIREIFEKVGFKKEYLEIKSEGVYTTIKCLK